MSAAHAERDSNIELLRLLAAVGVIALHVNNPLEGYGNALLLTSGANHVFLWLLQGIFTCAVDLFMLISGYFLCVTGRRDCWKFAGLLLEVSAVRVIDLVIRTFLHGEAFQIRSLCGALLPVNYFALLYTATYLLTPWLNLMSHRRTARELDMMMVAALVILSVWPTAVEILADATHADLGGLSTISREGSLSGYSLSNFLLMYLVGAWARAREDLLYKIPWSLVFFLAAILMGITGMLDDMGITCVNALRTYCSPLCVIASLAAFLWFRGMNLGRRRLVNRLASASFTTFLIHRYLFPFMHIEKVVSLPLPLMFIALILEIIVVLLVCLVADALWKAVGGRLVSILGHRFPARYEVRCGQLEVAPGFSSASDG